MYVSVTYRLWNIIFYEYYHVKCVLSLNNEEYSVYILPLGKGYLGNLGGNSP